MDNFVAIELLNGFRMSLQLRETEETAYLPSSLDQANPFDSKQTCDYEVLRPDKVMDYLVEFVQEINGIVKLNTTITRMLLSHCKWDKAVMMEKLYDNADKLYKEAHVINPASVNSVASQTDDKECAICFSELSPSMSAESTCGHQFCKPCLSEYLKVKIMDEGFGNSIACAASDCHMIIDDERVIQLVGDERAKIRYQKLITNSFVQQNELLRWCPAAGCSFVIKAAYVALNPICCYCKCGYEFCFGCSKEYHAPVTCALLGQYEMHEQLGRFRFLPNPDEQPKLRFGYDEKIKICPNPNCKVQLQNDEGCNIGKCRNCDSIFCWLCLNRYDSKTDAYGHWCKAIEEDENEERQVGTVGTAETSGHQERVRFRNSFDNSRDRPNFHKQFHLYNKYIDAADQLVSAHIFFVTNRKWLIDCRNKWRRDMFNSFNSWDNHSTNFGSILQHIHLVEFECASLEWIRSCRTLKYFAMFDIYVVNTAELTLLQNLVQNLEVAVDELKTLIFPISGISPIESEDLYDNIMRNIIPAYVNCQRRRCAVVDYVNEGFDNEWWTFKAEP